MHLALERHDQVDDAFELVRDQPVRRQQALRHVTPVGARGVGQQASRADLELLVAGDREARIVPPPRDDLAALHHRQRFADLDDLRAQPLQQRQGPAGRVHRQARQVEHLRSGTLYQPDVGGGGQLVPEADEDARPAAGGAAHQQVIDQAQDVVEARTAAVEAAGVVHGRVAALHDGRDAGAQDVGEALRVLDAAAPHRVEDGVGVGHLLQDVRDVLRGAHGFAALVGADVGPGFDHGDAVPIEFGHLHERREVLRSFDHLLQGRRQPPVEQAFLREHVAAGERCRRAAVPQEIPEQRMHGLGTRGVLAEDAGLVSPTEQGMGA